MILHFVAYRAINLKFNLTRRLNRGLAAMTSHSTVDNVKPILSIALDNLTYDLELEECIASADAVIDSELLKHGLSMPDTVPQNIADAALILQLGFSGIAGLQLKPLALERMWLERLRSQFLQR